MLSALAVAGGLVLAAWPSGLDEPIGLRDGDNPGGEAIHKSLLRFEHLAHRLAFLYRAIPRCGHFRADACCSLIFAGGLLRNRIDALENGRRGVDCCCPQCIAIHPKLQSWSGIAITSPGHDDEDVRGPLRARGSMTTVHYSERLQVRKAE